MLAISKLVVLLVTSQAARWGSDASWKHTLTPPPIGWQQLSYSDAAWTSPSVEEGVYGAYPWYTSAVFPPGTPARWIWNHDSISSYDTNTVYFRKVFTAVGSRAKLTLTADDAFTAWVNGTQVATGNYWPTSVTVEVPLVPGAQNVVAISAVNAGGPGGLLVEVDQNEAVEVPSQPQEDYFLETLPLPLCKLGPLATAVVRAKVTAVADVVTIRDGIYLGGVYTKLTVVVSEKIKGGSIPGTITVYGTGRVRFGHLVGSVPLTSIVSESTEVFLYLVQTEGRWFVQAGGGFFWSIGAQIYRNEMSAVPVSRSAIDLSVTPAGSCL